MSYIGIYDLTGIEPNSRFQDIEGATPSTTRIGRAVDLSGNGLDLAALDDNGRPGAQAGYALYDDYSNHRLASDAFPESGSETYVAVRFRQDSVDGSGNTLVARGNDDGGSWVAGDQGDGSFRLISPLVGTVLSGVSTTSGDHTLEVWAGSPARYSLDGGPILEAVHSWTNGFQRLVVGGRNVGLTNRSWKGRIYRVVAKSSSPDASERTDIQLWLEGLGPLPDQPPTPEELFRATFADASGNDPQQTALINPADVQRLINHNVSLWAGRPGRWKGRPKWYEFTAEHVPFGSLHKTEPGKRIYVKKDMPGLRHGKWLLILGREADTSRPGPVRLLCMGWEPDDQ